MISCQCDLDLNHPDIKREITAMCQCYIWLSPRESNTGTYQSTHLALAYPSLPSSPHHLPSPRHQRANPIMSQTLSSNPNISPGQDRNGNGPSIKSIQSVHHCEPPPPPTPPSPPPSPNQTNQCRIQTKPEGQSCQTIQSSSSLVTDVWHLSFDWCQNQISSAKVHCICLFESWTKRGGRRA